MPSEVTERAARIRAARGYSGLSQKELAKRLSISVETMSRIENGRRAATPEEALEVARICKVPPLFMETGFALIEERGAEATQGEFVRRLAALEEHVRQTAQPDLVLQDEAGRSVYVQLKSYADEPALDGPSRTIRVVSTDEATETLEQQVLAAFAALGTSTAPTGSGQVAQGQQGPHTEDDAG